MSYRTLVPYGPPQARDPAAWNTNNAMMNTPSTLHGTAGTPNTVSSIQPTSDVVIEKKIALIEFKQEIVNLKQGEESTESQEKIIYYQGKFDETKEALLKENDQDLVQFVATVEGCDSADQLFELLKELRK